MKYLNACLLSWLPLFVLTFFLIVSKNAVSSENSGNKWFSPTTTFYTDDLLGADGDWKEAFEEAADRWNDTATQFWIRTVRDIGGPGFCTSSGRNSARWSPTLCGDEWGENTLAVTSSYSSGGFLFKTDIVFNNTKDWDIYDGVRRSYANDFRRVAVHELGHAMGLGHLSDPKTIMAATINDSFLPQFDDVNALLSKYGNTYHKLTLSNNGNGKIIVEPLILGTGVVDVKTNILMVSNYQFLDCSEPVCEVSIQDGLRLAIRATPMQSFTGWVGTTIDYYSIQLSPMFSDRALTANYTSGTSGSSTTIPIQPTIALSSTSTSAVAISWAAISGSTSYKVFRCSSANTDSCGEPVADVSTTNYADAGGNAGMQYRYRVTACNNVGCSPFSNAVIGVKAFSIPPKPITTASSAFVIVAWANTQTSESTQLYRCTTTNISSCGVPIETLTNTTYTDSAGTAGIEYFYRIKVCSGGACSSFSDYASGTKTAVATAPSSPAAPLISASTSGVTLVWSNILTATSYEIYRCSSASLSSCATKIASSTAISYTDTNGVAGVIYFYRLKACNLNLCSELGSYSIGAKTAPITKPPAPSSLIASNTTLGVTLSWGAVAGATSYLVYTCTTVSQESCGRLPKGTSELSLSITDGTADRNYYFRTKSCNSAGCSDFSDYVTGSKIGYSIATFSQNKLTIPAVAVDTIFARFYFTVVLGIVSDSPVYEFTIVSSVAIENFEAGEYSTFNSMRNTLIIPKAQVGNIQYKLEFILVENGDSPVFQLISADEI